MYLSRVRVENYKCFRDSGEIRLERGLTVIIGPNNSGKSALLNALATNTSKPYQGLSHDGSSEPSPRIEWQITCSKEEVRSKLRTDEGYEFVAPSSGSLEAFDEAFASWINDNAAATISGVRRRGGVETEVRGFDMGTDWTFRAGRIRLRPRRHPEEVNNQAIHPEHELAAKFWESTYRFDAERPGLGRCAMGTTDSLASNASNLPSVLHVLSSNPVRYERYLNYVRRVVPSVRWVSAEPASATEIQLKVWHVDKGTERSDLAVTLAACGTGLGQVLAILYVATMSTSPRLLLIDEPQSFLHPAAARELVQILVETPHQCLITTHSPEVISAVEQCSLVRVDASDDGSRLLSVDRTSSQQLRIALAELGLRVSDMFGPDRILWVEGQTEEACFPIICRGLAGLSGRTRFHAVKAVGDFLDRKHARMAFDLYVTLTRGGAILSPTVGFMFDRERMSDGDAVELQRLAAVPVRELPPLRWTV